MARARKLLAKGADVESVLEALSKGLTQKMLHGTLAELHASREGRQQMAQTVAPVSAPDLPQPRGRRQ
jgi:glutamyl-tRNA reductase